MPAWNLKKEQHQRMGWVGSIKVGNITHLGRRAIVNTEIINTDNFSVTMLIMLKISDLIHGVYNVYRK